MNRKVFFLTESGRAPTENFTKILLKGLFKQLGDEDHLIVHKGPVWQSPKRLLADLEDTSIVCIIEKGENDSFSCFPLEGRNIGKVRKLLESGSGSSWSILRP